jgi:hypothetical protein
MSSETDFKTCPCCGHRWPSRDSFLSDNGLDAIGYQANLDNLKLGLFLFNHDRCRTTLSLHALEFLDLYDGPIFADRKTGSVECPGHCLHSHDLAVCQTACECAFVREVLQIVRGRQSGVEAFALALAAGH